jgi:hypothetical protein
MPEDPDIIPLNEIKKISQKAMRDNIGVMNALVEYDSRQTDHFAIGMACQSSLFIGLSLLSPQLLQRLIIVGNVGQSIKNGLYCFNPSQNGIQ